MLLTPFLIQCLFLENTKAMFVSKKVLREERKNVKENNFLIFGLLWEKIKNKK